MELPRSLAPWAHILNIFPREVSLALGPLIQRLALAIGPMRARSDRGAGDPDGFDGLARRGAYERLLASEWLLADEAPDEFSRRAAMGEHLFLRLARQEPSGSRVSLALFDAGPNQLGAPRIAHLAALIVLARRAEAAGARFGWSVLQQPDWPVFSTLTDSQVMRLLEARGPREATDDDLRAWRERLADWQELDDAWLVSGPRLDRLAAAGFSRLLVRDAFDAEARRLAATVKGALSAPREVTLDLPDDRTCARLLRDPFASAVVNMRRVAGARVPASNLVFDAGGLKLFARMQGGGVLAYPIPKAPHASAGRPKLYIATGSPPVAAGRLHRGIALITGQDVKFSLEYFTKGPAHMAAGEYVSGHAGIAFKPAEADAPLQPVYGRGEAHSREVIEAVLRDDTGLLFRLRPHPRPGPDLPGAGTYDLIGTEVAALAPLGSRLLFVGRAWQEERRVVASFGYREGRFFLPDSLGQGRAFIGSAADLTPEVGGLVAVEMGEGTWGVPMTGSIIYDIPNPPGAEVIGVTLKDWGGKEPALIALEDDRRTLTLNGRDFKRVIAAAAAPVAQVTAAPHLPCIAWATVHGEVVVYSTYFNTTLCRFTPEGRQ